MLQETPNHTDKVVRVEARKLGTSLSSCLHSRLQRSPRTTHLCFMIYHASALSSSQCIAEALAKMASPHPSVQKTLRGMRLFCRCFNCGARVCRSSRQGPKSNHTSLAHLQSHLWCGVMFSGLIDCVFGVPAS